MNVLCSLRALSSGNQFKAALSLPTRNLTVWVSGMSVWEDKKKVRKSVSKRLKEMSTQDQHSQSSSITDQILPTQFFNKSKATGLFLSVPKLNEVDTGPLVDAILSQRSSGKRCYAPAVEDKHSNMIFYHLDEMDSVKEMPPFGIREPTKTYSDGSARDDVLKMNVPLDLLILTGQAFDRAGERLGRGGGYYDKFIARCFERAKQQKWDPPLIVALTFKEQLVESIPKTENDVNMDILVLPDEMLACSKRGQDALKP